MQDEISPHIPMAQRIRSLLSQIEAQVDPVVVEQINGLLSVGEYRVAIENLCELLCEDAVVLHGSSRRELVSIAEALGLDERYSKIIPSS